MCKHGTTSAVRLCQPMENSARVEVPVDSCMAAAVQYLNDRGVHTLSSCCGHFGLSAGGILYEQGGKEYEIEFKKEASG